MHTYFAIDLIRLVYIALTMMAMIVIGVPLTIAWASYRGSVALPAIIFLLIFTAVGLYVGGVR